MHDALIGIQFTNCVSGTNIETRTILVDECCTGKARNVVYFLYSVQSIIYITVFVYINVLINDARRNIENINEKGNTLLGLLHQCYSTGIHLLSAILERFPKNRVVIESLVSQTENQSVNDKNQHL